MKVIVSNDFIYDEFINIWKTDLNKNYLVLYFILQNYYIN